MSKLKIFFKKIKDFIGFSLPTLEITPERQEELIEKWATNIAKVGLEFPAQMIGWYAGPMSNMFAQTVLLPMAPLLEFIGIDGYDYVAFLSDKENLKSLVERIKEKEGKWWPRI